MKRHLLNSIVALLPRRQWRRSFRERFLTSPLPRVEQQQGALTFPNVEIMKNSHIDQNCTIGEYTYIGYNCFITKAVIGRFSSIGNNVTVGAGEHKLDKISTSYFFTSENWYEELTEKPCTIGHDVWIGVDAIIRRGVQIGNGAVVGANSFVNKDVPDFAIVAGNPAKIIRYRFCEKVAEKISKSNWWEKDLHEARQIVQTLQKEVE